MAAPKRKVPLAASLSGMPEGKGSRTKLIKVTGIAGVPDFVLTGSKKLRLEIWTEGGNKLLGYLDVGAIPRWISPTDSKKGKEAYWENIEGWIQASHQFRKAR
jgi:hypothetical protein